MPKRTQAKRYVRRRKARLGPGASIAEAASMLDVSRSAVISLIDSGKLTVVLIGNKRRVTIGSIEALKAEVGMLDRAQA